MKGRDLLPAMALALLTLAAGCGHEKRPCRIGVLCGLDYLAALPAGFRDAMTELGYVEGRDVVYQVGRTNFDPAKEREILEGFVKDRVDLVLTCPTEVSMLARSILEPSGIPLVFAFANIEDTGLAASVQRPGGNATGVRYPGPEIAVERFEILLEIVPSARVLLVPYQRGYPIVPAQMKVLKAAAEPRGVRLIEAAVENAVALRGFLEALPPQESEAIDAILIIAEPLGVTSEAVEELARFAVPRRIPCGGPSISVAGYGSIFGANPDISDTGRQAALQAHRVLQGSRAGEVPVVSAENRLDINCAAAAALGLTVPQPLLNRAHSIQR